MRGRAEGGLAGIGRMKELAGIGRAEGDLAGILRTEGGLAGILRVEVGLAGIVRSVRGLAGIGCAEGGLAGLRLYTMQTIIRIHTFVVTAFLFFA